MTAHLADTPVLETDRFILRAPVAADYPVWRDFFVSERARYIGGGPGFDHGRAWRAFASMVGHWAIRGFGTFSIEDRGSGQPLGGVGPWYPGDWPETEIGWTIWDPAFEGVGAMAETVPIVLTHAYEALNWHTAVSYIHPENTRSIALAERLGARHDPDAPWHRDDGTLVYRHPGPEVSR